MKIRSLVIGALFVALSASVAGCTKKSESTAEVLSSDVIKTAVIDFLTEYKDCLANNASESDGGVNTCVESNSQASTAFRQDVAQTGLIEKGLDPIFCGAGVPDKFIIWSAVGQTPTEGSGLIQESYAGEKNIVAFQVKQSGDSVQITGNTCPTN